MTEDANPPVGSIEHADEIIRPDQQVERSAFYSCRGRVGRLRFTLRLIGLSAGLGLVLGIVVLAASQAPPVAIGVAVLLGLPVAWLMVALVVKRLHDVNLAAWHLAWMVPVLLAPTIATGGPERLILSIGNTLLQLWLVFKRGSRGPNRFGPDPFTRETFEAVGSAPAAAQVKAGSSRRRWVLVGLFTIAVIGAAVIGLAELSGPDVPSCSDAGVTSRVALLAGGIANLKLTTHDIRTMSNDEPLNGRTCVATVDVTVIAGPEAGKKLSSQQVGYTLQMVDGQSGRYIVRLAE